MWRQAGGQQRRRRQQTAATGNGVDEAGDECDKGQNGQSGEVNTEFERHGVGLFGGVQERTAGKGRHLTYIRLLRRPVYTTKPLCEPARESGSSVNDYVEG
jgi:hypothetical protein